MITVKELKKNREVQALLSVTERQLEVLGFTEHSNRHVSIVSNWAGDILRATGADERTVNLGEIAGYIHDIGNAINRNDHAQSGAILAYNILTKLGMDCDDAAEVMMAIGNHDEGQGQPVSVVSSALIIADKSDVHRSRVRRNKLIKGISINDIHDRVNYAAESSHLEFDKKNKIILLNIVIDTEICPVMDYFEIYYGRMKLCRRAAEYMGWTFSLKINQSVLL